MQPDVASAYLVLLDKLGSCFGCMNVWRFKINIL